MTTRPTLGTLLRRLTEQLDGAVEGSYAAAGLDYRPRYTPIIRSLIEHGPATIRALSDRTGVSHSAASQTVSQMLERDLVALTSGTDARERIVALTDTARAMIPRLERLWAATETAARSLDDELGLSLPDILARTLALLDRKPFADRLADSAPPAKADLA